MTAHMALDAKLLAVASGLVYLLGYVVANSHYARFGAAPVGLLEVRYVSAGLLFLAFTIVPIVVGGTAATMPRVKHRIAAVFGFSALFVVGVLLQSGFWLWVRTRVAIDAGIPWSGLAPFIVSSIVVPISAALLFRAPLPKGESPLLWVPFRAAVSVIMVCLLGSSFGRVIYPNIGPEFGGGAGWSGTVQLVDDDPEVQGVVIDIGDQRVTLYQCVAGGSRVDVIPVSLVSSIVLRSRVNAASQHDSCGQASGP